MRSVILHNPGCNNPDELCSPHPSGLVDTTQYMMANPFETLAIMVAILGVTIGLVAVRRYTRPDPA